MPDELLDIVNDKDTITGQEMRSVVHELGLQHRGVHVFLFTSDGRMLVQKRSADRSTSPSAFDCSVSEHVKAGESYIEAAMRGTREELGLDGIQVRRLVKFKMNYGVNDNEISTLYEGQVRPADVKFDPEEIESVHYFSLNELWDMVNGGTVEFCGWFVELLKWYAGKASKMILLDQPSLIPKN